MNDTKKKILLVDDDIDILEQTGTHLRAAGYEVITAESESQAHELLESFKPDLAILDLMMENQDSGFILAHRVKKMDPGLPVILVTAVTNQTRIPFDLPAGENRDWIKADAVLAKDVRYEQLLGEVNRLL